jgi:effector-binding domain-containing protein
MDTLKKISFSLLLIVFVIVTIGFLLPRKIHVERTRIMKAPVELLFDQVNTLTNWNNWSPWNRLDTAMKIEYHGITGTGSGYSWTSTNSQVGNGSLTILLSRPYDSIIVNIDFMDQVPAYSSYIFKVVPEGTQLTWSMDFQMNKNPFRRYMGLFMDKWIGSDYEKGLTRLDSITLDFAKKHPLIKIVEKEVSSFNYIYLERTSNFTEIGVVLSGAYADLMKQLTKSGTRLAGPPFVMYRSFDSISASYEAALPVTGELKLKEPVRFGKTPPERALVAEYYGPYSGISVAYKAITDYSKAKGLKLKEYMWESYITDPATEPDSSKWLTEVYYPVQ